MTAAESLFSQQRYCGKRMGKFSALKFLTLKNPCAGVSVLQTQSPNSSVEEEAHSYALERVLPRMASHLINTPSTTVTDSLDGLLLSAPHLRRLDGFPDVRDSSQSARNAAIQLVVACLTAVGPCKAFTPPLYLDV
jgi:hypothetical protein